MDKYDIYQLLRLFEFSLMTYYKTDLPMTNDRICSGINDLIQSIYLSSQRGDGDDYLNVNLILQADKEFNRLIGFMSDVTSNQSDLFNAIKRDGHANISHLHRNNKVLLDKDRQIIETYMSIEHI